MEKNHLRAPIMVILFWMMILIVVIVEAEDTPSRSLSPSLTFELLKPTIDEKPKPKIDGHYSYIYTHYLKSILKMLNVSRRF